MDEMSKELKRVRMRSLATKLQKEGGRLGNEVVVDKQRGTEASDQIKWKKEFVN